MNWDNLKFFLAVCRHGSIRAAAKQLNVNHATVSRRINHFEESLGERLFERSKEGYLLNQLGEEIFQEATHLEERLNTVERKVAGKDKALKGTIRITIPESIGEILFVKHFAQFCEKYPDIELEVLESGRKFNLTNREADIAFRVCTDPPEHLIGRKLGTIHRAVYIAKNRLPKAIDNDWIKQQNWIGWSEKERRPIGKLARRYRNFGSKHKISGGTMQVSACKEGLGVAILPCFMGDAEPDLVRIPPGDTEAKWDIWLLYHPELRHNTKIQTFVRFCVEALNKNRAFIEQGKIANN